MSDDAILILGDEQYRFPVREGTEGERAIDIQDLRARTGHITLDPGYGNTGSCQSAITFIDGEEGILRYRGIPIEQFEHEPNFVEVAWLLIFGHLPSPEEYQAFSASLTAVSAQAVSALSHAAIAVPSRCSTPVVRAARACRTLL